MAYGTRPVAPRPEPGETMPDTITLTKEQFDALLASRNTGAEGLTAEALAKAFSKASRPENPQAPMVSVYNPRGETDHPRPRLRAKTLQNGVELQEDTLTWEEIDALNTLPPGEFRVTKGTGTKIPFSVKLTRGLDGESLERVDIHYPCKDDNRYDHRPLLDYCFEVLESAGLEAEVTRLKALVRELNALRKV